MSVYIKGMEMPINCCDCPMSGDYRMCCSLMPGVPALYAEFADAIKTNRRHKDCPLIPVPEHGDLIDRDALPWEKQSLMEADEDWALPCVLIEDAPTIIPADHFADADKMVADKEWPEWRSQVLGQPYKEDKEGKG